MVDPQPYDQVRLHPAPAHTHGIDPTTTLLVADTVNDQPNTYVLWHLDTHPDHHDWAAAVTTGDIRTITRITPTGDVRTWTPST